MSSRTAPAVPSSSSGIEVEAPSFAEVVGLILRARQRAFFAAAVSEAQTQAEPARPAPTRPAEQPEPERYLRPGSIIDIKI